MNNRSTAYLVDGDTHSSAIYSPCKSYRYSLVRRQINAKKHLLFILLNPSTATEIKNDPTITRCQNRSEALGYKAFIICNLFAFRTKSPKVMKSVRDPIGPENNSIIQESLNLADQVICGWGNHGTHLNQSETILKIIKASQTTAFHLGLTQNSQPAHPLYISYKQKPIRF